MTKKTKSENLPEPDIEVEEDDPCMDCESDDCSGCEHEWKSDGTDSGSN